MRKLIALCCLLLTVCHLKAQVKKHNVLTFDSLNFAAIKKQLNAIDATPFEKLDFESNGEKMRYRLLKPKNVLSTVKYPLVIALHNSSRIGTDNELQLEPLTRIWLKNDLRERYPAFVLAPQFAERPTIYSENDSSKILTATAQPNLQLLVKLISQIIENPQIDKNRIYLIGYSMGGSTAQHLLSQDPNLFAAMVAVAGVPNFSNIQQISKKPIWLIHGLKDNENPFVGSEKLFELLNGNNKLRFTIYDNLDHNNINSAILATDDLAKWLFQWKNNK